MMLKAVATCCVVTRWLLE